MNIEHPGNHHNVKSIPTEVINGVVSCRFSLTKIYLRISVTVYLNVKHPWTCYQTGYFIIQVFTIVFQVSGAWIAGGRISFLLNVLVTSGCWLVDVKTLEEAVVNIVYISLLPSEDLNSSAMAPVRQVVFVLSWVVGTVLIYLQLLKGFLSLHSIRV